MGVSKSKRKKNESFFEKNPKCCFCDGKNSASTRDHYPPKAIFNGGHRPNDLVVPACEFCNSLSRRSDQIVAAISRLSIEENPDGVIDKDVQKFANALAKNEPEIVEEWLCLSLGTQQKRARRTLIKRGINIPINSKIATFGKLTRPHLHLFVYKLTLAIFYHETGDIIGNAGIIRAFFFLKEDILTGKLPPEFGVYMGQLKTLRQGNWSVADEFEYRCATNDNATLFAMEARIRKSIVIIGFAAMVGKISGLNLDDMCISPSNLQSILIDTHFKLRR